MALDIFVLETDRKEAKQLLLHIYKDLMESIGLISVAKKFIVLTDECQKHFGNLMATLLFINLYTCIPGILS